MILINGKEIIDEVSIEENLSFETICLAHPPMLGSYKTDIIEKERFTNSQIPYVDYPPPIIKGFNPYYGFGTGKCRVGNVICETGYVNIENGEKSIVPIRIGNIEIQKICVSTQGLFKPFYSSYYDRIHGLDGGWWEFHYEFVIIIFGGNNEYLKHTFYADSKLRSKDIYDNWTYNKTYSGPIRTLLGSIIPLLNSFLSLAFPLEQINFFYINQLLPQKEDNCNVHPFKFTDALDIVYSSQIIQDEDNWIIEIGKGFKPYMNLYIVSLINSILNINLNFDKEAGTFKATLPNKIDYPQKLISFRNFILCLLYIGIYEKYDEKKAKEHFLVLPSIKERNLIDLQKDYLEIIPDLSFLQLFDFIADIEATLIEDGITRVGRDDYEWKEKTFIIPYKKDFWASSVFIEKINEILKIKLIFEDEVNSHDSWNNHPSRYYYFEKYDAVYIAGLACSRHDIGSFELTQKSFYKLLEYFMKEYISCCITSSSR